MRIWVAGAVCAAAVAASACGGSSGPSSTPTASHSATPVPTPSAGPPLVVWTVTSGSSTVIRALTPAGSSAHTIATIPSSSVVLAVAAGKLVYLPLSNPMTMHVVTLTTGADTSYPTGATSSSDTVFGAAVSPDGTRVAYVVSAMSGASSLRILTLATSSSSTIRTFSGGMPVDAPGLWTATRMVAIGVVPYSDAGPQWISTLDPASGAQTASTMTAGSSGPVYSDDAMHAANSIHTPTLGDDGDVAGGPGPQQPFNTLRTFTVGGSPSVVYQKPHHNINVLAVSTAGSNVLYFNDSSAGGFAGITMSPEFGLFMYSGASAPGTQIEHLDGPRWDAARFVDDSTAFAARHVGSNEELIMFSASHPTPVVVDSVSGGDSPVSVGFSPIS